MCGVYISKRDYTATPGEGELTIKKGNLLFVPDLCRHMERMVALYNNPKSVGFVNRSCLEVESAPGKQTLGMVCNSFRAKIRPLPF